ncbi:MAG: NYN domain-containing protein [Bacteroidetes bacterium]|nr:NYN domain-containing protein [Bacteroidota bacterium]
MPTPKLAVLIDSDNAQASLASELMNEIARYGLATIKRAYGDWTTQNLASWKKTLHDLAIQPIQQFAYTTGKNSTDSALIIDAMDMLHTAEVDGFCLVSSDSDFTRLATRLRESGKTVYGFGEKKTPKPFIAACDKFIFTEILKHEPEKQSPNQSSSPKLKTSLLTAIDAAAKDDGWASLSAVGQMISQADPSFDSRNYGSSKLSGLVQGLTYIECKAVQSSPDSVTKHIYIRRKT